VLNRRAGDQQEENSKRTRFRRFLISSPPVNVCLVNSVTAIRECYENYRQLGTTEAALIELALEVQPSLYFTATTTVCGPGSACCVVS
jgi:hypothetical protein